MVNERPLTRLQLDILELESRAWSQEGAKASDFRRLHPDVTMTGYTVALLRLLTDRRAYEYDGGRYAATLSRIQRLHAERDAARAATRGVEDR